METMGIVDKEFWKGKKVFITGNTGFKGSWLSLWLHNMGADVTGFALEPETKPSLFKILNLKEKTNCVFGDIRNKDLLNLSLKKSKCEVAFHLAAQSLVRKSYINPYETFSTNIMGTVNFFEALKRSDTVEVAVNITSDKCYENNDLLTSFSEKFPMGGTDPYSSSKGCSELITSSYMKSFFSKNVKNYANIKIASARAGNVIGGGDWSEDRLIPDIINDFLKEKKPIIRSPKATRPWQHVLDPLNGYLILAEELYNSKNESLCGGWNFGTNLKESKDVEWIADYLKLIWPKKVNWVIDHKSNPYEAKYLSLDCSKSKKFLGWEPNYELKECLKGIMDWHLALENQRDMSQFTLNQIKHYIEKNE